MKKELTISYEKDETQKENSKINFIPKLLEEQKDENIECFRKKTIYKFSKFSERDMEIIFGKMSKDAKTLKMISKHPFSSKIIDINLKLKESESIIESEIYFQKDGVSLKYFVNQQNNLRDDLKLKILEQTLSFLSFRENFQMDYFFDINLNSFSINEKKESVKFSDYKFPNILNDSQLCYNLVNDEKYNKNPEYFVKYEKAINYTAPELINDIDFQKYQPNHLSLVFSWGIFAYLLLGGTEITEEGINLDQFKYNQKNCNKVFEKLLEKTKNRFLNSEIFSKLYPIIRTTLEFDINKRLSFEKLYSLIKSINLLSTENIKKKIDKYLKIASIDNEAKKNKFQTTLRKTLDTYELSPIIPIKIIKNHTSISLKKEKVGSGIQEERSNQNSMNFSTFKKEEIKSFNFPEDNKNKEDLSLNENKPNNAPPPSFNNLSRTNQGIQNPPLNTQVSTNSSASKSNQGNENKFLYNNPSTYAISNQNNKGKNLISEISKKNNNEEIINIFKEYKSSEKISQEGYSIDLTHYHVEDNLIMEIHYEIEKFYKMNKIFKIIICEYDYDSLKFLGKPSQISNVGMEFLIKMLNRCNNLEQLSLARCLMKDDQIDSLCKSLKNCMNIKTLCLMSCKIKEPQALNIIESLSKSSLETLDFNDNLIEGKQFSVLIKRLHFHIESTMKSLFLGHNSIGNENLRELPKVLKVISNPNNKRNNLQKFHFSANFIGKEGLCNILMLLKRSTKLTHLWLGGNHFGDEGAKLLVDSFGKLAEIELLFVDSNFITSEGASFISSGIVELKKLKSLDVSNNNFGDEGIYALSKKASDCIKLTFLNIKNNTASYEAILELVEKLVTSKIFHNLKFAKNIITSFEKEQLKKKINRI